MNHRDKKYLAYVRRHSSCLWGEPEEWVEQGSSSHDPTVAHHCHLWGDGGIALKPSDYRTVPLSAAEHVNLHNMGEKAFWAQYEVDPMEVVVTLLTGFVRDKGAIVEAFLSYRKHRSDRMLLTDLEMIAVREG